VAIQMSPGGLAGRRRPVRAVAHVHSEWSDDGSWTLRRIVTTFARLGHDVVLMSEHSRGFTAAKWQEYLAACQQASSDQLLVVPGIEYGDEDDVVHIPVWGHVPFLGAALPTGKLLPMVSEVGGIAMWAHPWRRDAWRRFEPAWLDHLTAVEVWNRKYDGIAPSRAALALVRREGMRATVALDFHTRRQLFPLTLRLDVNDDLTVPAVFTALATGRFAPHAFGIPLPPLVRGPGGAALQALESLRRAGSRAIR
jgi:hypothetical protein